MDDVRKAAATATVEFPELGLASFTLMKRGADEVLPSNSRLGISTTQASWYAARHHTGGL